MAKEFAKAFYKSKAWQQCRTAFIRSKFGLCEICKQPGYIVHHKTKLTPENISDPEVTLGWNNLQYLCVECHNVAHGDAQATRHDVMFNESGDLVMSKRQPHGSA